MNEYAFSDLLVVSKSPILTGIIVSHYFATSFLLYMSQLYLLILRVYWHPCISLSAFVSDKTLSSLCVVLKVRFVRFYGEDVCLSIRSGFDSNARVKIRNQRIRRV